MFKAILNEHQNAANSDTKFVTSNYGLEVCPRKELEAVLNPEFKPKPVYPGAKGRRQWQNVGTTKPTTGRELSNELSSKLSSQPLSMLRCQLPRHLGRGMRNPQNS